MKRHRTIRYRLHPGSLAKTKKLYGTAEACRYVWNHFVGKLQGEYLHIQRIGQVKLSGNNPYEDAKPVSCTIKKEARGWHAYIVYEVEITGLPSSIKPVGIDRNVGQVTRSDGVVHRVPDVSFLEARKRRYQRMMARRQRGSRKQGIQPSHRYMKAKNLHARTVQKIVQTRTNWCHQVSREIANQYNVAYLEDLNTQGMTARGKGKTGLNRGILNTGWHKLEQCLSYKASVVKVAPHYTSQTCNQCGHTAKENRKTQADFECVKCGHRDNADINAALNILAFGNGAAGRGDGGISWPGKRQMDTDSPLRT